MQYTKETMSRKYLICACVCALMVVVSADADWTKQPVHIYSECNESLAFGYHKDDSSKLYVVANDAANALEKIRVVDGLAGGATISFQDKNDAKKYLCPENGYMVLKTEEDSIAFKMAASFFETSPLNGGNGLSYESVQNFDFFIHYNAGGQLRVDQWKDEPVYACRASWKPHFAEIHVTL